MLKRLFIGFTAFLSVAMGSGCAPQSESVFAYGVFIGLTAEDAQKLEGYDTVVIDAAYFSKEQVGELTGKGQTVYSYLNIGSVESFRDYYERFEGITLGVYENWRDERWVDISELSWRDFICDSLAAELAEKGISGFFIDNADLYYNFPEEEIYSGLLDTLSRLSEYGLDIMVNGGDTFVAEAIERGELAEAGINAVNQECVFTAIDFDGGTFHRQTAEETEYFTQYLRECDANGLEIYITEYAAPSKSALRGEIAEYCDENGYGYYIASSLELDG